MSRWGGALAAAALLAACGPGRDNWPAGRPLIDDVRYVEQAPQSGGRLLFEIDFLDTDGDLGQGVLRLLINDAENSVLPLPDLFANQVPQIAATATEGVVEVLVKVEGDIPPSAEIDVGFVLEDATGKRSNHSTVTLRAVTTERTR